MAAPSFVQVVAAGLGGSVGSSLRFLVSGWVHHRLPGSTFPWGTLSVNVAGCLPIVVEIVDTRETIDRLLAEIEPAIGGGLATLERVEIHWYRGADRPG